MAAEAASRKQRAPDWCDENSPLLHRRLNQENGEEHSHFQSKLGLILSCLGCVVGTGNIWRFPRIVANNAGNEGGLTFLMCWLLFLFIWSIPIIIIEYAVGRFTHKTTVESFKTLIGPRSMWCGAWMALVNTFIASYYSVVLGWCFYYFFLTAIEDLPTTHKDSLKNWNHLQDSEYIPVLCHLMSVLLAGTAIIRGVKSIETANKIFVPTLLIIIIMSFCWSLSLRFAGHGIKFMFAPDWDVLKEPRMWVDAASQNAWDTGAGVGLFLTYATYMTRANGVVKFGTVLPACNNLISLICCITTFSTVFSMKMQEDPPADKADIVTLLKENGQANTGLTFIWMPILYQSVGGAVGRALCCLFFLCLSLAGLSSLVSILELIAHAIVDMGVRRLVAVPLVVTLVFCLGLPSALDLDILVNQDYVWGYALILAGATVLSLPLLYGANRFREDLVNEYGLDDWHLPRSWEIIVKYIVPVEALCLIVWWAVDLLYNSKDWKALTPESFLPTIIQWFGWLAILVTANMVWYYTREHARENPAQYMFANGGNQYDDDYSSTGTA